MTEQFWMTIFVGIVSPIITAVLINWGKSKDRDEDRKDRAAAAALLKAVDSKVDGMLADRDKANIKEGERNATAIGAATAKTLADGISQGLEIARANAPAPAAVATGGLKVEAAPGVDIEVATRDKRAGAELEKANQLAERSTIAQERLADTAANPPKAP